MDSIDPQSDLQGVVASLRDLAQELGPLAQAEHGPLWLALDQGGHASRAIVFDSAGRQVAQAFAPIQTQTFPGERVEHNPLEIVQSLRTVLADVTQSLGRDVDRIQAAGLATQRSSIVCWHAASGAPLSPVLSWQDRRNDALVKTLHAHREQIQAITGLVLSPHYGASKLRWCLEELPDVRAALEQRQLRCGPLSSYLLHALLIERPTLVDPANASRTQLWSPSSLHWSPLLLEWFGIPQDCLPKPVSTMHHYGHVLLGDRQIPLVACTGDQAAVPFANGALDDACIYVNLGTGAFALAPLAAEVTQAAPLLRSVLYSSATQVTFALEGTVNGAASALTWLAERSGLDVQRGALALQRALLPPNIPIFINGIGGIGSPYWLPQVSSHFVWDEAVSSDDSAQLAAVIESIAFLLTANIQLMRAQQPQLARVLLGGGLAACAYLCQCLADLNELPVTRLSERELTARGLAYLVANQPAHWPGDAQTTVFQPQAYPDLHARHSQFIIHMQACKPPSELRPAICD